MLICIPLYKQVLSELKAIKIEFFWRVIIPHYIKNTSPRYKSFFTVRAIILKQSEQILNHSLP